MEIIWGTTLPFPQEYPEEPQRFHNLKPCVIMTYASAYTNIFCVIKRGGRAGAVGPCDALIWPLARCLQPRVSPSSSQTLPKHPDRGNHHVLQPSAPAFTTLPVHPASPTCDHVHNQVLQLCMEAALWLPMVGPLTGQLKGTANSPGSPPIWFPQAQALQLSMHSIINRSDVRWSRTDLQAHPRLNDNCLALLSSLTSHPCPWLHSSLKGWAFSFRWLPGCKEIHSGRGVRLDQAKFHCMFISAQIILLKRRKQSCSRWERLFIASHGYLACFTEGLSSCTQGIMLSSNLRKHPWDFQPPLEIEIQQETTNTPRN